MGITFKDCLRPKSNMDVDKLSLEEIKQLLLEERNKNALLRQQISQPVLIGYISYIIQ